MLIRVPLMILFGFFIIHSKGEQLTTGKISTKDKNSSRSNGTTIEESDDHLNSSLHNTTSVINNNIIVIKIDSSESSNERNLEKTRRNDSVIDIPAELDLKQETESDKDFDKIKDADLLDSNIISVVASKTPVLETDDINYRSFNPDSVIKDSNSNDTSHDPKLSNTTDTDIKDKSIIDLESGEIISDYRLEPHISRVFRRNHTDNAYDPIDTEENHNGTKSKISRDADNSKTNKESLKEFTVNDKNGGTNKKNTTKLSNPQLEPDIKITQIFKRCGKDNVYESCNSEQNHNESESKTSKNADNNNTNTESSDKSIVNDLIEGRNDKDKIKTEGSTPVNHNNEQSEDLKVRFSSITKIDSKENIERDKNVLPMNAVFTRRSFNYNDNEYFIENNVETADKTTITDHATNAEQPKTTEHNNNYYDPVENRSSMRRNLNYDNELSREPPEKRTKTNYIDLNDYPFGVTQRNDLNDLIIDDTVKQIVAVIESKDLGTAISRSGRPDGGYIAEPYDEYREPNVVKPPKDLACCQGEPSSLNYETTNGYIILPIYGIIQLLLPIAVFGKPIETKPNIIRNRNEQVFHYPFPELQRLYQNYGNPEALNVFQNHANTFPSSAYIDHGNNVAYPENHGIVFGNKKIPLPSHENSFINHEYLSTIHENSNAKYPANQPDYDASSNHFLHREQSRRSNYENDKNDYPRADKSIRTNQGNPLSNHDLITHRVYPSAGNTNDNTMHGNHVNQPNDVPFYHNFQHHDPSLLVPHQIDDFHSKFHPHADAVHHQTTGIVNPVSSRASVVPNSYSTQRYPVKSVPFRKFFLISR